MEFLSYVSLVLSLAVSQSLDVSQAVIFVVFIIAGVVAHFYPKYAMTEHVSSWKVAAIVLGAVIAARVVTAPYWAYEDMKERKIDAEQKLIAIGTDRPFYYVDIRMNVEQTTSGNGVTIALNFENKGDKAIRYTIKKIYLSVNGKDADTVPNFDQPVFMPAHALRDFNFPTVLNVDLSKLPIILKFGWLIEYDNVPPTVKRITERDIQDEVTSFQPPVNYSHIVHEDER